MFRICKIASLATKNVRLGFYIHPQQSVVIPGVHIQHRFYAKDKKPDDGCKPFQSDQAASPKQKRPGPPECKPGERSPCKEPTPDCEKKTLPYLQECAKPNLMSDCPKPDCPYDDSAACHRKRNRNILLIGLLLTAATIGALLFFTDMSKPSEGKVKAVKPKKTKKKREIIKIPPTSAEIPDQVPYLLVGGGTASFSAFRAIKSADPKAKVLVISSEGHLPYMRPPLSKELWFNEDKESVKKLEFKQWNGSQRSLFYEPDDFYMECKDLLASENGGVSVARGWSIDRIDVVNKKAYLEDGKEITYDKCLIATGAIPRSLEIFEASDDVITKKVSVYRNVYDFEDLNEVTEEAKAIAIVGGGFLGSELACALGRRSKNSKVKIYQIFREGGNMGKILPEYLSYWTTEKVKAEGVEVVPNANVIGAIPDGKGVALTLSTGSVIKTDHVVVTIGVEPNTELAEKSDLEVDPELGGFLVNTELQARSNLFIAGDCACFYDTKLGRRRVEHHDHAVVSGRLAGENMTGSGKPYLHQSMFWSDLGPDVGYEAIGIVDSKLPTVGVFAKATDKDNPKAVVTAHDEGIRSKTENAIPDECKKFADKEKVEEEEKKAAADRKELSKPQEGEDFGKGVIFYLRDDIVVGIVLWNVFNRMSVARQVLKDERKYEDLNEVAKLFNIHEE